MAEKFQVIVQGKNFYSNKKQAIDLASTSFFGELKEGKVAYSIFEVLYLLEKNKIEIIENNKKIEFNALLNKYKKHVETYLVFKDLREKGNIVKEGLKFGCDFRIYEKGKKPAKDHAAYLVWVLNYKDKLSLKDYSAKNRVAHSTNKNLLLAIVDSEGDVTYIESNWKNLS